MIIPDANLLLYAYDSTSPFHPPAAQWWRKCLEGAEPIGLATVVLFGFVRIGTNSRVFANPMTLSEAAGHVRSWLARPCAQLLDPGVKHVEQVLRMLEAVGAGGNLLSDAQLAAIAIEHEAVLHTADTDFLRFKQLRWFNPLSGVGSNGLKRTKTP